MLHADPTQRPTISDVQADEFFTSGYVPLRLPTTCLTVPPRFSMGPSAAVELNQRRPLTAINNKGNDHETLNVSKYSVSTGFDGDLLISSRHRKGGHEGGAHEKVRYTLNSLLLGSVYTRVHISQDSCVKRGGGSFLSREPEPAENHLKDMLQQLNVLIAAKPSEKAVVCQGDGLPLVPLCGRLVFAFQH